MFDETMRNLREIAPLIFGSAPIAFTMLADAWNATIAARQILLEAAPGLQRRDAVGRPHERMQALAIKATGNRLPLRQQCTAPPKRKASPSSTDHRTRGPHRLAVAGPHVEAGTQRPEAEVRVKGPTVTGLFEPPRFTEAAFDEEGFTNSATPQNSSIRTNRRGPHFDGRVTEDSASSGTWSQSARCAPTSLRSRRSYRTAWSQAWTRYIAVLAWPNMAAAREICSTPILKRPTKSCARRRWRNSSASAYACFQSAGGSSGRSTRHADNRTQSIGSHEI